MSGWTTKPLRKGIDRETKDRKGVRKWKEKNSRKVEIKEKNNNNDNKQQTKTGHN